MHYSREDGKWQLGQKAGLLSELRKRMSAEEYEAQKKALQNFLGGYFSTGNCTNSQGSSISPMKATPLGGKVLKVRWAYGKLSILFTQAHQERDERFGNARFVRNVFENTQNRHSDRLVQSGCLDKGSLTTFDSADVSLSEFSSLVDEAVDLADYRWSAVCLACQKTKNADVKCLNQAVK